MVTIINTFAKGAVASVGKFWRDEEGATATEYGLIVALISALIIVASKGLSTSISAAFSNMSTYIK